MKQPSPVAEFFYDNEKTLALIVARAMSHERKLDPDRKSLLDEADIPRILALAQHRLETMQPAPVVDASDGWAGLVFQALSRASSQVCVEKVEAAAERMKVEGGLEEIIVDGARIWRLAGTCV